MNGGVFALFEVSGFWDVVAIIVRFLLAAIAFLIGWFLARPAAAALHRLILRRPIGPKTLTVSRIVGAVGCAVLMFIFFPGLGGGGGGTGGGKGRGEGEGKSDREGKSGKGKDVKLEKRPEVKPGETLRVEMITSERYNKKKDNRWYLIDGKEPPLTLAEVEDVFKQNKGKLRDVDIIVWGNSVPPDDPAVQQLMAVAARYKLRAYRPMEYWEKEKKVDKSE